MGLICSHSHAASEKIWKNRIPAVALTSLVNPGFATDAGLENITNSPRSKHVSTA